MLGALDLSLVEFISLRKNSDSCKEQSINFCPFFFYWKIIALQYCVGLCHTSTCISHRCTYVPSLQNPPALLPVSRRKFPLAVYFTYGNVYVSMLFSPFVPPSLPPLCPQFCSLCLHLHCWRRDIFESHYSPTTCSLRAGLCHCPWGFSRTQAQGPLSGRW